MATARKSPKPHNRSGGFRTISKKTKGGTTQRTVAVKGSHVRKKSK